MLNKFSFTCPIFNVKTHFEHCTTLRNEMFGGKTVAVRKGCQACIASSKCPAALEYRESIYGRKALYPHYVSPDEPKHGKLRAEVLESILPVKVQDIHLNMYAVPAVEQELIATANDRIRDQLKTAPKVALQPYVQPKASRETLQAKPRPQFTPIRPLENVTRNEEPAPIPSTNHAAATGDMSAAINA